ncbi:MAG: hypothetical protein GY817_08295 [bacterium]|nr:hypothetical protein [bacterium]
MTYIYKDYGHPGNKFGIIEMNGDTNNIKMLNNVSIGHKEGLSCMKIMYYPNDVDNAIINGWSSLKLKLYLPQNFSGYTKIIFWIRGEVGGETIDSIRVGTSEKNELGSLILRNTWEQYEIGLESLEINLTDTGLMMIFEADSNPQGSIFYLDDVHFV